MKRIVIFFVITGLFFGLKAQTPSASDSVVGNKKVDQKEYRAGMRVGNKLYESGKPSDAETEYRRVLGYEDKSNKAAFNLGDALYKQEKYDKAAEQFKTAAEAAEKKEDKSRAYYNWGNSLLKQQKLKESIDAYKNALRNDPNDIDAKRNLSYALNLLKQQEQQKNKPPQNEEPNKILEQAKKLVAQRKYKEAYDLMKAGEKKYPELQQHQDFTNRISDIIKMN